MLSGPPHCAAVTFVNVKRNTDFDLSTSPIQVISGLPGQVKITQAYRATAEKAANESDRVELSNGLRFKLESERCSAITFK